MIYSFNFILEVLKFFPFLIIFLSEIRPFVNIDICDFFFDIYFLCNKYKCILNVFFYTGNFALSVL